VTRISDCLLPRPCAVPPLETAVSPQTISGDPVSARRLVIEYASADVAGANRGPVERCSALVEDRGHRRRRGDERKCAEGPGC
jgi:hypothetical protein